MPPCVPSIRNCGRPSSRGSQPMPAFWVIPKMSPLGRSSSISAVRGRLPCGPTPAVSMRHSAGSESTICSNPKFFSATPAFLPFPLDDVGSRGHDERRAGILLSPRGAMSPTPTLSRETAAAVRARFGTPCYVYDRAILEAAARSALAFPAPFGYTLRYAMKANPSRGVLAVFRELGLHIDASSDHEVERALRAGFRPASIQLTSQMPSPRLPEYLERGILYNACSLHQLEAVGRAAPG